MGAGRSLLADDFLDLLGGGRRNFGRLRNERLVILVVGHDGQLCRVVSCDASPWADIAFARGVMGVEMGGGRVVARLIGNGKG